MDALSASLRSVGTGALSAPGGFDRREPQRAGASAQEQVLQGPAHQPFDLSVRRAPDPWTGRQSFEVEGEPYAAKFHSQDLHCFLGCRWIQEQNLLEAAPYRSVEHSFVIRRGDDDTVSGIGIEHLQHGIDDAAQLTVLGLVFAFFADGVELVEEGHCRGGGSEIEHFPEIRGSLAQEGGHHAVRPDDGERPIHFAGDDFGGQSLSAARRTAEEQTLAGAEAVRQQHLATVVFAEEFLDGSAIPRREDDVLQVALGPPDGEQREKADTGAAYLDALERLLLVEPQPAWSPRLRSRATLRQAPVRHFVDPSLAAAALRATPERLLGDLRFLGFLFESLVVRDLRIYAQPVEAEVFHYREKDGLEADAVVDAGDGRWAAFEVELGERWVDEAAANLLRLQARMRGNRDGYGEPSALAVVIPGGAAYRRPDGVSVVPAATLGP